MQCITPHCQLVVGTQSFYTKCWRCCGERTECMGFQRTFPHLRLPHIDRWYHARMNAVASSIILWYAVISRCESPTNRNEIVPGEKLNDFIYKLDFLSISHINKS